MKTSFTFDLKTILIVIVLLVVLLGGGFGWLGMKLDDTATQLAQQINLTEALQADIKYTKNKLDEEVATKQTLQASIKELKKLNGSLSENQKELLKRINDLKRDNELISAALVITETKIDSLLVDDGDVTVGDDYVNVAKVTDSLIFDVTMNNVQPIEPFKQPSIMFKELKIPNKQFIEFHWDNDKKRYQKPVSFSITNSSPFVTTLEADSYIIPEVNKNVLKPSFGEKLGEFFNKPVVKIVGGVIIFSGGVYVGATAF